MTIDEPMDPLDDLRTSEDDELRFDDGGEMIDVVHFRIGARWFALSAADVREVVTEESIIRVPSLPKQLSGLALVRGQLVPVIDLVEVSQDIPRGEAADTLPRLVIFEVGDEPVALRAAEAHGIVTAEVTQLPKEISLPYLPIAARHEDKLLLVIDPGELVAAVLHR